MTAVGPANQQGVISTQVERVQNDKPTATQAAQPVQVVQQDAPPPPPPPPADSGRGTEVNVTI